MELSDLLRQVTTALQGLGVAHFVTGSMATVIYGEPRFTNDIDLVADLSAANVEGLLAAFPAPEWYLDLERVARAVRQRGQFNLLHPTSGLKVDFMVSESDAFDRQRFARTRSVEIGDGLTVSYASPEDVILKKLVYYQLGGSDKHLRDIAGVMRLTEIDTAYVNEWADRLGVLGAWQELKNRRSLNPEGGGGGR